MAMPDDRASRGEAKRTGVPSSRISPAYAPWTPAMIFISVDLPAPFSPTSPWISSVSRAKSTSRKAVTPPNDLLIPRSSRRGATVSDQEVLLHPHHPGGVGAGDDWSVGDDAIGDAALAGLLAPHHGGNACDDRTAMDSAGRIAHGCVHPAVAHCLQRR